MSGWQLAVLILVLAVAACALSELRFRAAQRKMVRVLRGGPKNALELVKQHRFRRGSIYVLLLRMEEDGIVERYWPPDEHKQHGQKFRLREAS